MVNRSNLSGIIAINIAAILFGTAALFGKLAVSPYWIVATRAGFAALTLTIWGIVSRKLGSVPPSNMRRRLVASGVVLAVHWLTFFASVQLAGVAIATLTFAAYPLFTVLLETVRIGRKPTIHEVTSGLAIIVAVAMLVGVDHTQSIFLGAAVGLTSAISFAYFGIAAKHISTFVAPLTVSLTQNTVVLACLAPVLPFVTPSPHSAFEWLWLALLGIVTTALMHQLYLFALKKLSPTTCSGFIALEPVYAVVFAAIFFDEPISPWVGLSGALIIGASLALLRNEAKS
ncbi:MAG: DMT family transporter [Oligoflexales bacterium]